MTTKESKRLRRNLLQSGRCSVCDSNYEDIAIGHHHIYGLCPKCDRRDEIGLVFY